MRQAGYRLTRPRQAILAYLSEADSHPSAWEIYQESRKAYPGLTLATVYNTLTVLLRTGLVKVLEYRLQSRYETKLTPHGHLICVRCGRIRDLELPAPWNPEDLVTTQDFQALDYRMEIFGICRECQGCDLQQPFFKNGKEVRRWPKNLRLF